MINIHFKNIKFVISNVVSESNMKYRITEKMPHEKLYRYNIISNKRHHINKERVWKMILISCHYFILKRFPNTVSSLCLYLESEFCIVFMLNYNEQLTTTSGQIVEMKMMSWCWCVIFYTYSNCFRIFFNCTVESSFKRTNELCTLIVIVVPMGNTHCVF